jgi:hypothetical protein
LRDFSSYISPYEKYVSFERNISHEQCLGYDANNEFLRAEDAHGCVVRGPYDPKCDPTNPVSSYIYKSAAGYGGGGVYKNKTVADLTWTYGGDYNVINRAAYGWVSILVLFLGCFTLWGSVAWTVQKQQIMIMTCIVLILGLSDIYLRMIPNIRKAYGFKDCHNMDPAVYYNTRPASECRTLNTLPFPDSVQNTDQYSFLTGSRYEDYLKDCSIFKTQTACTKSSQAPSKAPCTWIGPNGLNATKATSNAKAKRAVPENTCVNRFMDGLYSYKCTPEEEKYWYGTKKCGKFSDQIVVNDWSWSVPNPCGDWVDMLPQHCWMRKMVSIQGRNGQPKGLTATRTCTWKREEEVYEAVYHADPSQNCWANRTVKRCQDVFPNTDTVIKRYGELLSSRDHLINNKVNVLVGQAFTSDYKSYLSIPDKTDPQYNMKTQRFGYMKDFEPCTKELHARVVYYKSSQNYTYYNSRKPKTTTPRVCFTDIEGNNVDVLAQTYATRVSVAQAGLVFAYFTLCFTLLYLFQANYLWDAEKNQPRDIELGRRANSWKELAPTATGPRAPAATGPRATTKGAVRK